MSAINVGTQQNPSYPPADYCIDLPAQPFQREIESYPDVVGNKIPNGKPVEKPRHQWCSSFRDGAPDRDHPCKWNA